MKRVLGIDPGLNHTGWGVIEACGDNMSWISHGVLHPPKKLSLSERLLFLHKNVSDIITKYQPSEICIEDIFVNANPESSIKLGMARGVLIMLPAFFKLNLFEYTANQVKKAVAGFGHAQKDQIMQMVQLLILPKMPLTPDSADALAVAICHAGHICIPD